MDHVEACSKIDQSTKTTGQIPATPVNRLGGATGRALDAVAPTLAPLALRWDAEADRRRQLRTPEHLTALVAAQRAHNQARLKAAKARQSRKAARAASRNPLSSGRRVAAMTDRAATAARREARAELRSARQDYPLSLAGLAARLHAVHAVPAAAASALMTHAHGLTLWPVATSAALVAGHVSALRVGRRGAVAPAAPEGLSEEETQLLGRLAPEWWAEHAPARGLEGTVTGTPEMTPKGVTCQVRLDDKWELEGFQKAAGRIRALLGVRTDTPMRITAGTRGGWAVITLRTRSAVGTGAILWTPETVGIGLDVETGEPVTMPTNERMLFAGSSGSGKSTSLRPLMADVVRDPLSALAIIDIKRVEAGLWRPRARVAVTYDQAGDLAGELLAEMYDRLEVMEAAGDDLWRPTAARPRITLIVDEGTLLMSGPKEVRQAVVELGLAGRAAEIVVWWCTQKPLTADGPSAGIPTQLAGQMDVRAALKLASATDCRTVFGDDATEKGWDAHLQPKPGYLMVRGTGRGPVSVKTWYMDKEAVKALPERAPWSRGAVPATGPAPDPGPGGRRLTLVKDAAVPAATPTVPAVQLTESEAKVLRALLDADGPQRHGGLVTLTGMPKGTVSKAIGGLTGHGLVARDGQTYTATSAAAEVSA